MNIAHIDQLNAIFGTDAHREASKLVEGALAEIGKEIYTRDEAFRLAAYAEVIFQTCQAVLDDGGSNATLWLLKIATTDVRSEAADRARTQVGPFLDAMNLEDRLAGAIGLLEERKAA